MAIRIIQKLIYTIVLSSGVIFLLMLSLSITPLPFYTERWLGLSHEHADTAPHYLVMLGGGGMPGEANLMRLYATTLVYEKCTVKPKIIISHPTDSIEMGLMIKELILKGVRQNDILTEDVGSNTRSQALGVMQIIDSIGKSKVVLISSPTHMYRAVKTFRKAGFKQVTGQSAFEDITKIRLHFSDEKLGGNKHIPSIGNNLSIRYNIWNYLQLEIQCMREFVAIFYYWTKNWI